MTDEQIVKALKCCSSHKGCKNCDFYKHDTCFVVHEKEILEVIKRQQAEIKGLKAELKKIRDEESEEDYK